MCDNAAVQYALCNAVMMVQDKIDVVQESAQYRSTVQCSEILLLWRRKYTGEDNVRLGSYVR
jgi:hypothetical protein